MKVPSAPCLLPHRCHNGTNPHPIALRSLIIRERRIGDGHSSVAYVLVSLRPWFLQFLVKDIE